MPRSFSRTTDRAVEITPVSIRMNPISPGTRNWLDFSSGLYQTRGRYERRGGPADTPASAAIRTFCSVTRAEA